MAKNESGKKLIMEELAKLGFTNYYLQIFDSECSIDLRSDLLLKFIGMDPALNGYHYIKEGIRYVTSSKVIPSTMAIYENVAKKFDKETSCVERSIRHAKEKTFKKMKPEVKNLVFGNDTSSSSRNASFIYSLINFMSSIEI